MSSKVSLFAAVAIGLAVPAAAQSPNAPPPRPMPPGAMGRPDHAAMRQAHADDMALLLGLRADQRAALEAMLRAEMPPRPERPDRGAPGAEQGSFGARLAEMQRHMRERADRAQQRFAALSSFYQGLDAQQRVRFDALMRLSHGPMGMRGMHPGGPEGPMGPMGPGGPGGHAMHGGEAPPPPPPAR